MWLLNERTGELLAGRCRATNLCTYCRTLYTVETVEMLTLDAIEYAPTIWVVLTAREHLTRAQCRRHLAQLLKAARRRWQGVEWFVQVEFQRRGALHLNLLVKGVDAADVEQLRDVLVGRWCARVDAEPVGQWADVVNDGYGVTRYIAKLLAHGLKVEQAPPIGWRGHRTSQTRGYLVRPAAVMRDEARKSLQAKRRLHRSIGKAAAIADGTPTADLVEFVYEQLEAAEHGTTFRLINTLPAQRRWSDTGRLVLKGRADPPAAGDAQHDARQSTARRKRGSDSQDPGKRPHAHRPERGEARGRTGSSEPVAAPAAAADVVTRAPQRHALRAHPRASGARAPSAAPARSP